MLGMITFCRSWWVTGQQCMKALGWSQISKLTLFTTWLDVWSTPCWEAQRIHKMGSGAQEKKLNCKQLCEKASGKCHGMPEMSLWPRDVEHRVWGRRLSLIIPSVLWKAWSIVQRFIKCHWWQESHTFWSTIPYNAVFIHGSRKCSKDQTDLKKKPQETLLQHTGRRPLKCIFHMQKCFRYVNI